MVVNLERLYSERALKLKASEIRELLKLTQLPGMISLAGGLPNPRAFPIEVIRKCIDKVLRENAVNALQYGTTEGLPKLRIVLAERMREKKGIDCERHDILVTNGAQQGLTLLAFTFLNPGDTVITGAPTYLGATQAFHAFAEEPLNIQTLGRSVILALADQWKPGQLPDRLRRTVAGLEALQSAGEAG